MKYLYVLCFVLISCSRIYNHTGPQGQPGATGQEGASCTSQAITNGVVIECPNSPPLTLYNGSQGLQGLQGIQGDTGLTGQPGTNGTNGVNGVGIVFTIIQADNTQCSNGGSVLVVASDTQGTGLYSVLDAGQQSLVVCNGATGAQGIQGQQGVAGPVSQFSPVIPITPCGQASSPWKEVLLCLEDGQVLADFSASASGLDTRLSFLPTGSYQDTDSSGCNFSVGVDSQGNTTVSWSAGSNSYSTWTANTVVCQNNS